MSSLEKPDSGLSRAQLLARLAKHGPRAIDVLAAASHAGDTNAAKAILSKLVPDLKAVDITQMEAHGSRIVIAPRIFIKSDGKGGTVKLPDININVDTKAVEAPNIQEIDITDSLKASPPVMESVVPTNFREQRKKGKYA